MGVARLLVPKELVPAFQTPAAALFTDISWVENGPIKRKEVPLQSKSRRTRDAHHNQPREDWNIGCSVES